MEKVKRLKCQYGEGGCYVTKKSRQKKRSNATRYKVNGTKGGPQRKLLDKIRKMDACWKGPNPYKYLYIA